MLERIRESLITTSAGIASASVAIYYIATSRTVDEQIIAGILGMAATLLGLFSKDR